MSTHSFIIKWCFSTVHESKHADDCTCIILDANFFMQAVMCGEEGVVIDDSVDSWDLNLFYVCKRKKKKNKDERA